jgi:hypothetical protein
MKLKIVIVDFEIPAHVKKWALRAGIPVALLVAGGAVARAGMDAGAGGLVTWADGQTLRSADLNGNFSALEAQIPVLTAWQSYAPVLQTLDTTPVPVTGATVTGQWRRVGDTLDVRIFVDGTPTTTSASRWTMTLPAGLVIDSTKLAGPNDAVGGGAIEDGVIVVQTTANANTLYFALSGGPPISESTGADIFYAYASVPIVGWTVGGATP